MSAQGMLQLAVYLAVLLLLVKPLGAFMAAVFEGRRTFLSPVLQPVERLIYRAGGVDATRETRLEAVCTPGGSCQRRRLCLRLSIAAPARRVAAQSAGLRRGEPGLLVQHGREFRHQHQLAGLRRRIDDELSHADAGLGRAELPVRRLRHGGAGRADSRLCASPGRARSAISGWISRAARSMCCCRCRCCSRSCWCRRASCRASRRTARSS